MQFKTNSVGCCHKELLPFVITDIYTVLPKLLRRFGNFQSPQEVVWFLLVLGERTVENNSIKLAEIPGSRFFRAEYKMLEKFKKCLENSGD